ncbi:MAG: hypothetical protein JWR07_4588 [Nevskia sp.]|nr:hypothetical protein [Nevskia sp.]
MKAAYSSVCAAAIAAAMFFHVSATHAAAGDPLGLEFQVDNGTGTYFSAPAAARDGAGDTVIAWARAGAGQGVYARLYDPSGTPKGPEFAVPLGHAPAAAVPAVAMDRAGDFVVANTTADAAKQSFTIQAQRYSVNGTALGAPITVASVPKLIVLGFASAPSLAMDADGDFIVVWSQGVVFDFNIPDTLDAAAGARLIFARRYGSNGVAKGPAFLVVGDPPDVLITGGGPQAVAMDDNGNFVVAWNNENLYRDTVEFKRYNTNGLQLGLKVEAKPLSDKFPYGLQLAMDAAGNFILFWTEGGIGGPYHEVAQRYSAVGKAQGAAAVISSQTGQVGMQSDGEFALVWGDSSNVKAQRYSAGAVAEGGIIPVSSSIGSPVAAFDGYGDFVVAWAGGPISGVNLYSSIHARLFSGH